MPSPIRSDHARAGGRSPGDAPVGLPAHCAAPAGLLAGRRSCLASLLGALGVLYLPGPGRAQTAQGGRVALVIGNAQYAQLPLKNAVQDAQRVAQAAAQLGFAVSSLVDASHLQMIDAIRLFYRDAAAAQVRLVYFCGHGAQYRGRNFLIPVDAALQSEDDLPSQAVDAVDLADRLARFTSGVNLLVLDACRTSPLHHGTGRTRGLRHGEDGLAERVAPRGTLIAYSTAPGRVASDGGQGDGGPYARNLARELTVAAMPIESVFKRVRLAVMQETGNQQVPWESSSLVGELCLREEPGVACGAVAGGPAR